MPKTNPDIKSKVGNVNHPFSKRENEAALKMWGSHPARQAVVNGGGAVYDALQEFKDAQTNFGANTPASVVNPNQNTNAGDVYPWRLPLQFEHSKSGSIPRECDGPRHNATYPHLPEDDIHDQCDGRHKRARPDRSRRVHRPRPHEW